MTRRIIDVAGQRVLDAEERAPGYRVDLVRALVQAIQAQDAEVSEKGRRDKIASTVDALAVKVRSRRSAT